MPGLQVSADSADTYDMIITQDITRIVQALLKDTAGSLVEATWQSLTPLNLTPGQMVHGEVMANLANSRYLVRIANELLHMELPLNLQPGQAVELTYVTDEPRLLFTLSKSGNSPIPVQISDTGRWLNNLAQETGDTPAAAPLPRPALVMNGPPRDSALLAEGLKNVLTRSGVFYESHLSQWVQGEHPLTGLLQEPQGKLSPLAARLPADGTLPLTPQGATAAQTPSATPQAPVTTADTLPPGQAGSPEASRTVQAEAAPPQQRGTESAVAGAPRQGGTPDGTGTATATPQGGQAPATDPGDALSHAPAPATPQNQSAAPSRPGEQPIPAQPQQPGTSVSPQPAPAGETPPSPQSATAPATDPQGKLPGEATTGTPPPQIPGKPLEPQPRDTMLLRPAEGERSAAAPAPDPRATAGPGTLPENTPAHAAVKGAATPSPSPAIQDTGMRTAIPSETVSAERGAAGRPMTPPTPSGVEPQTISLIKEQLATLTTGVFLWQGQVWPGQDMEWKVEEREAEGGKGERSWQTEVSVELPSLGAIRATLRSGKEGIAVVLAAEEGRTAEVLASRQEGLEERFGAAGLRLGGFVVRDGTQ